LFEANIRVREKQQEYRMRDTIAGALNTAMKAQDKLRVPTLRLIMAAIKDRDILNRGTG
jgi:uncharacterized protein